MDRFSFMILWSNSIELVLNNILNVILMPTNRLYVLCSIRFFVKYLMQFSLFFFILRLLMASQFVPPLNSFLIKNSLHILFIYYSFRFLCFASRLKQLVNNLPEKGTAIQKINRRWHSSLQTDAAAFSFYYWIIAIEICFF